MTSVTLCFQGKIIRILYKKIPNIQTDTYIAFCHPPSLNTFKQNFKDT